MTFELALDTNVLLEIASIVDLNREAIKEPYDAALLEARRQRVRASLALAWFLHRNRQRSISLRNEPLLKARELAPPETADGDHVWFYTWFLRDYVLSGWSDDVSTDAEFDDLTRGGNERDRLLVRLAHREGVCVVTNETYPKGAIAKEAAKLGVTVHTPREYLATHGASVDDGCPELLTAMERSLICFLVDRGEHLFERAITVCAHYYEVMRYILVGPAAATSASPENADSARR